MNLKFFVKQFHLFFILMKCLDSRPWHQAWPTKGPSRFHGVQTKIQFEIPLNMVENFPFHFSNHLRVFS
jgi:hypothetical protein